MKRNFLRCSLFYRSSTLLQLFIALLQLNRFLYNTATLTAVKVYADIQTRLKPLLRISGEMLGGLGLRARGLGPFTFLKCFKFYFYFKSVHKKRITTNFTITTNVQTNFLCCQYILDEGMKRHTFKVFFYLKKYRKYLFEPSMIIFHWKSPELV